jgi:HlyD family secretion protein
MKWRSKKVIIGGPALLLLIVLVAWNMAGSGDEATMIQADLAYSDEISEIVTASGRVQPQTKVDITSEVSAQIMDIFVKDGDRVTRGQPLLLLDTIQLMADVAQMQFSLEELSARADASRSTSERDRLEYERQEKLHKQNLASETQFTNAKFTNETSQANYQAMRAQVNTARARLEKARDNLRKTRITSPMAGIVTFLGCEVGEIAQAQNSFTQGKTLMTVADLSVFEVEVDVDETEIAKVQVGQKSEIRVDAFSDTTFAGHVVEIGNSAQTSGQGTENYTTSFRVKVRFAETDAPIRPGMSATVDITTAHEDDALLIPYAAVVTREFDENKPEKTEADTGDGVFAAEPDSDADTVATDDEATDAEKPKGKKPKLEKKTGVFICKDGIAKFVEIQTGIADERNIVALTGLAPGDTVISGSFQTLRKIEEDEAVKIDERSLEAMSEGN